jgi:hypothetical protein
VAVASAALGALAATPLQDAAHAKSRPAGDQPGQPSAAEMEAWMKAATPGEEHKALADMVGRWKSTISCTMKPGEQPVSSTGTDEFRMDMDGRYLVQEHTGEMMGQPFKGHGIYAYNNVTGEYECIWYDNMGTGIMHATGKKDPSGDLTFAGDFTCPINGPSKYREVLKKVGDNEYEFTMYTTYPSKPEYKSMDIKYTRTP